MSKNIYRATNVKQVSFDKLADSVRGLSIIVGIDIAKTDNFACLTGEDGRIIEIIKWPHPDSTLDFVSLLLSLPVAKLVVALEPSGVYGDCLRFLLAKRGVDVYMVSAKRCHDAAEVYDGVPSSHDAKSASVIARLHLDGGSRLWELDSEPLAELKAAIDIMEIYDSEYHRNLNRLEAVFARHWPEATRIISLQTKTLLTLCRDLGGPARISANSVAARKVMRKIGGSMLSEEKIDKLMESAPSTLGVPLNNVELEKLKLLCKIILELKRKADQAKKKVEKLGENSPSIKAMGKVVGKSTAAIIATEVGDPIEFTSASAFEKAAGLNIKERSSGKHQGRRRITKRGSGVARRWLYMAVLRLIQQDEIVAAWYHSKIKRDGGVKMKALVALMRKLIKALWYVGQGEEFDSSKLFNIELLGISIA